MSEQPWEEDSVTWQALKNSEAEVYKLKQQLRRVSKAMLEAADELDEWDGDASAALGGVSPGGLIRHALERALKEKT